MAERVQKHRCAVLITCFNRVDKTTNCLNSLFSSSCKDVLDVYLLDDGSKDGTGDFVEKQFPQVRLIRGDGNLYWSGGLRVVYAEARKVGYQNYLWLNDDNELDADALERLFYWAEMLGDNAILVGSMREREGGISYGGFQRSRWRPLYFHRVAPCDESPLDVDTANGNLMLIPKQISDSVGDVPSQLQHNGADILYAVEARNRGFSVQLLPGTFGVCPTNPVAPKLRGLPGIKKRLQTKELPIGPTIYIYKKLAGHTWPFWLAVTYVKALLNG